MYMHINILYCISYARWPPVFECLSHSLIRHLVSEIFMFESVKFVNARTDAWMDDGSSPIL